MTAGRDVRLQVFVGFPGSADGVLSLDEAGRPRFAGRQDSNRVAEAGGTPNPYKGLEAFDERDAERFFGREAVVTRLWESFRALHEGAIHLGWQTSWRRASPRCCPSPVETAESAQAVADLEWHAPPSSRRALPRLGRTEQYVRPLAKARCGGWNRSRACVPRAQNPH